MNFKILISKYEFLFTMVTIVVLSTISESLFAANLTRLSRDPWPYAVAPVRSQDVVLPVAGMPSQYIYVQSNATPTSGGDLCDKSTTGIRTYDISNPTNPVMVSLVNAPNSTHPTLMKAVHLPSGQNVLLVTNSLCQFTTADGKNMVSNTAQTNNNSLSGFDIYDLSNPAIPKLISTNNLKGIINGQGIATFVQNSIPYAIVATEGPSSPFYYFIFDIRNPKKPLLIRQISAAENQQLIWPIAVNGFTQVLSSGKNPDVKTINNKQIAFLPIQSGGVVLFDLTDIAGPASNASRFISQMAQPISDPVSGLAPHDASFIQVSDDNKYAIVVEGGENNSRLNAHYGAAAPLLSSTESFFTQPIVSGETFTTIRIPGAGVGGLDQACGTVTPAGTANQMAVISRGTCTFAVKADNVAAAGYGGMLVVNNLPLAGSLGMGGGLRTDNFRAFAVSYEVGTNASLTPSGQVMTLDKVPIPWGYTRLWDISDLLHPKIIANITTPLTTYAPIPNLDVFFQHNSAVFEEANDHGRLILSTGSEGYNIYDLANLNTTPVITLTHSTGMINIDTSLVNPNEFLGLQNIISFLDANYKFGSDDIAYTEYLLPYTINNMKILIGVSDADGLVIYKDPAP